MQEDAQKAIREVGLTLKPFWCFAEYDSADSFLFFFLEEGAYITGYAIAFIGTMFIPIAGWVGKIAKVDKLIPDELLTLLRTQGEDPAIFLESF